MRATSRGGRAAKKPVPKSEMQQVLAYLRTQLVAVVSTVSPERRPQSATVFFWANDVVGDDFSLFFVTRRHSRKFENLMSNKAVAVTVGTEFAPATVQIDGDAELLDAGNALADMSELQVRLKAKPALARLLAGEFFPRNPVRDLGSDFALFRVQPRWIRWMHLAADKKKVVYSEVLAGNGN